MANIHEVNILCKIPFDCGSDKIAQTLGRLQMPQMGVMAHWTGKRDEVPNSHGGVTTRYECHFYGEEACGFSFWSAFLKELIDNGGDCEVAKIRDFEDDSDWRDVPIPKKSV